MKKIVFPLVVFSFLSVFLWGCATVEPENKTDTAVQQKTNKSITKKKSAQKPQSKSGTFCGDREVSDDF